MSPMEFCDRFHLHPPANLLESFSKQLPPAWLGLITPLNRRTNPMALYVATEQNKSSQFHLLSAKKIYRILELKGKEPYTCAQRWERVYGDSVFHNDLKWRHWHLLPFKTSHSIQLQNFMFRIAYRIIPTQVYLQQLRVVDSELCSHCSLRDDLLHFFFECHSVKAFWDSLATWIDANQEVMDFPEDLTEEEFLLGTSSTAFPHLLLNYIMMWAKFYIYKVKIFGNGGTDLFQFLLELKDRLSLERLACISDSSYRKRFRKWEPFYNSF